MDLNNYLYLIINALIISIPLSLSFHHTLKFYRRWKRILFSFLTIGVFYIVWDVVFTRLGVWSFSQEYTTGIKLFSLPLAEILFFLTVPYACIFIYESIRYHLPARQMVVPQLIQLFLIFVFALIALIFNNQTYTFVVCFSAIAAISANLIFTKLGIIEDLFSKSEYWLFLAFSFIGFLIVNYILTSLPIVEYNPADFSQIRILTIPLEDFVYNFSLLTLYLIFYEVSGKLFNEW